MPQIEKKIMILYAANNRIIRTYGNKILHLDSDEYLNIHL